MKALIRFALAAMMLITTLTAQAGWVSGHYRSSGTYVAPYYRSDSGSLGHSYSSSSGYVDRNRSNDKDRTCKASAAESLVSPFTTVGCRGTCQKLPSKLLCHSVTGTIILRRSFPTPSELMTTAGLVLLISWPFVGFRSMSQISPRFGFWLLVLMKSVAFGYVPILRFFVMFLQLLCLRLKNSPSFLNREF